MLNKQENVENKNTLKNSKKNGVTKNGNGTNGHAAIDFSAIKTGGTFLTNVVAVSYTHLTLPTNREV